MLTFAFVGEPVTGDRPDRKRTPFSVRLCTDDLIQRRGNRLRYAAHVVDPAVQTTLDMIVVLEEELFEANEQGDWQKLAALVPEEEREELGVEGSGGRCHEVQVVCNLEKKPLTPLRAHRNAY